MNEQLYEALISEIKKKFPKRSRIADTLTDILLIEKGAVYRRLRGDVPFTFDEIALITKKLGISLDNIIGIEAQKHRPFQLRLPNFISPQEVDYYLLDSFINFLCSTNTLENAEIAFASNVLPQGLFGGFYYLAKFNLFNWNYHYSNDNVTKFHELRIPDKIMAIAQEQYLEMKKFTKAHYVFDTKIFQHYVNNINYFHSIRLIEKEDILNVKEDLFAILDYLEEIAITGKFRETGNSVNLYISDIDITTSYFYINAENIFYSAIKAFILTATTSLDKETFEKVKNWIHSLIKISTLITLTNEKQRVLFFEKQHKIIDEL